jgi:hypothetical protein
MVRGNAEYGTSDQGDEVDQSIGMLSALIARIQGMDLLIGPVVAKLKAYKEKSHTHEWEYSLDRWGIESHRKCECGVQEWKHYVNSRDINSAPWTTNPHRDDAIKERLDNKSAHGATIDGSSTGVSRTD